MHLRFCGYAMNSRFWTGCSTSLQSTSAAAHRRPHARCRHLVTSNVPVLNFCARELGSWWSDGKESFLEFKRNRNQKPVRGRLSIAGSWIEAPALHGGFRRLVQQRIAAGGFYFYLAGCAVGFHEYPQHDRTLFLILPRQRRIAGFSIAGGITCRN